MITSNNFYTIFENFEEFKNECDKYDSQLKIWIENKKLKTMSKNKPVNFTKEHCAIFDNPDEIMKEIKINAFKEKPKQTLQEFNDKQILINQTLQANLYSEKNTDSLMMRYYDNLFKKYFNYSRLYYTKVDKKIINFNHKIPDGYDLINDDILVIIENKANVKDLKNAKLQIENYKESVKDLFKTVYLIIGLGTEDLKIHFFKNTVNKEISENDFIYELQKLNPRNNNILDIHRLNQFLYDEGINLGNVNEKIKTLCKLYEVSRNINKYDLGDFINKSNDESQIIKYFVNNIKNNSENVINEIFNEILIYSNEHNDVNKEGTVITPSYISYLMTYFIKNAENLVVYDPCCGNCALELHLLNNNNKFYLNDIDKNRVELSKMFMDFNGIDYKIINNNSFNVDIPKDVNFIILNPPYVTDNNSKRLTNKLETNMIIDMIIKGKKLNHEILLSAIIPSHDLKIPKFLDFLRKNTEIIHTIKLNKDAFKPMAIIDTSIILLKINSEIKQNYDFKCYNAINDNAYELSRGKSMKRVVKNFGIKNLPFKIININENSFICLFNEDIEIEKILNSDELKDLQSDNIKGIIRSLVTYKFIDFDISEDKNEIIKIRNKEHDLNQQIYNKYNELLDVEDKILLFILYKLNLDFEQTLLPFKYVKTTFEELDEENYLMTLFNKLVEKINIKQIKEIVDLFNDDIDIEALFEDIAKYAIHEETNSKFGIVFTNKIIVNNMINSLNISKNDDFLDFCCGSGNFPMAASKFKPKSITGIEISRLTSILAKVLLKSINGNYKIFCDNAFNDKYTKNKLYDKIAINPPYNGILDDKNYEQIKNFTSSEIPEKFIVFGINKLNNNGMLSAVVPNSCLRNKKLLDYIRSTCEVIEVITYDSEMFKESNVGIGVSQITIRKTTNKHNTFKCSLFDKGYKIIHKIINKYSEPKIIKTIEKTMLDNDWNFTNNEDLEITDEFINDLRKKIILANIENYISSLNFDFPNLDNKKFIKVKLSDIFEIVKGKSYNIKNAVNNGKYPLISSSKINNGIIGYLNTFDYNKNLYTLSSFGSCGYLFKQYINFNIRGHGSIIVLKNKIEFNEIVNLPLISYQLSKNYSWSNAITKTNFKDIEVFIYKGNVETVDVNQYVENFKPPNLDLYPKRFKKVKLSDIFKISLTSKNHIKKERIDNGLYPLIGSGKINNGIIGYLNTYDYENCYTLAKNGSVGFITYRQYKFSKTTDCYVLNKIKEIDDNINLPLISYQLMKQFNWTNKINSTNFNNIEVFIYEDKTY